MGKALEVTNLDITLNDNTKDYTGIKSDSGIKILRPAGRNYNNQMLWWCSCGYCHHEFIELPARILNGHKKSCGCIKNKNKKYKKYNVEYSFYDWCIDNDHKNWLGLWDYELNDLLPEQVSYKSSYSCWFKCKNKKDHPSEKHKLLNMINQNHIICHMCNSFAQWGIDTFGDDFLERYWDCDKNEVDPWNISRASGNKVWIKCQEKEYHGSYLIMCNKFSGGECRCPYCSKNSGKVHKFDSLGYLYPEVLNIWSDKNDKTPYEYSPQTNKKVWFKYKNGKHEDYKQIINNAVNREFRCPACVKEEKDSILQTKVSSYIKTNYNYTLLHEQNCSIKPINPKTNYPMPYDNEILELKLIIEVNGEQHYKPSHFIKMNAKRNNISVEEQFERRQFKDEYKKQYALSHGFDFLEIPYTAEKDSKYKEMIDNKINEIISRKNIV